MKKLILLILELPNIIYNFFLMKRKKVVHGNALTIRGRMIIQGSGEIVIGNNVTIYSKPDYNPSAGGARMCMTVNGKLNIGNNTGMSHCAITANESVVIEENVLIGSNSMICDTDFHSLNYEIRISGHDTDAKTSPVRICSGAFVGARCIILKGVTIGEKSIIGAGSVVTRDVPAGEIWAGNPARFIRRI